MDFSSVIGLKHLKHHLKTTLERGRIAHAQLFIGNHGSGTLPLAIAYAHDILCSHHPAGSVAYENCSKKIQHLAHPDLHFVYPVATNAKDKKAALSDSYSEDWRVFATQNSYGSLFEWYQHIGIENKQGNINVKEAEAISKKLALKAYEGGYKVMIIWMADQMNTECANKILKLVEEPPQNTVLILITENEEQIINTILSRCQKLLIPSLPENEIAKGLIEKRGVTEKDAIKISRKAHGDFQRALHILENSGEDLIFEKWFIKWVRTAFKAKGNKKSVQELLQWSESMAKEGRETQKNFLLYCVELFRQALLKNYSAESLVYLDTHDEKFTLEKFAPFVHQNNIFEITEALQNATYHIQRNGNAKIIFADLSIQLTKLIHRK